MASYGFTNDKPERLSGIETTWDPGTITHLDALGVGPGSNCLEVGAGGGSIARWLAERVGPNGSVLATDLDTTHIAGLAGGVVEVRQHDLLTDELPGAAFDVVHARLLLEWLGNSDGFERLAAAVAPGGCLLVEDFDWAIGGVMDDSTREMVKPLRAILDLLDGVGYQRHYGRSLLGRVERAGFEACGAASRSYLLHGGSAGTAFERLSFLAHRDRLIGSGALTEAEFDEVIGQMNDPEYYVATPLMWAAWGRKPA